MIPRSSSHTLGGKGESNNSNACHFCQDTWQEITFTEHKECKSGLGSSEATSEI